MKKQLIFTIICFISIFLVALATIAIYYQFQPPTIAMKEAVSHEQELIPSSLPATPSATILHLLSTGDLMIGRSVNATGVKRKNFSWSFEEVTPELQKFDYVIANLETPIVTDCPVTIEGMIFCADASASSALANSPISLVTLANNHIANYGNEGIHDTFHLLENAGQAYAAEDELFMTEINGHQLGVLALDDVTHPVDLDTIGEIINKAKSQVDILAIALHFGAEYRYQPATSQIELAHTLIDHGADLIIGNHSHWLGPIEIYRGKAIIYSHGNFVFDQMWSTETRQGLAINSIFNPDHQLEKLEIYPIWITDYGRAHWVAGESEGEQILDIFAHLVPEATHSGNHLEINIKPSHQ
ncbi:CapA family protein [bacterium]|nr:CapA family protein [bacterium]